MSAAHPGLAWRFDDSLREVPADEAAFRMALDVLVEAIATTRSHPQKFLDALGEAAPLLRIGGPAGHDAAPARARTRGAG